VGYYPSGPTCTPCSAIHPNCLKCSAGAICTECNAAGHWVIRNSSCACAVGFFDSSGVCLVCTTLDLSCLTCQQISGVAECLTCLTGFFPENTACLPCTTNLVGCMDCYVNGSTCIVCDNPNNWELVSGQCLCVTGYYLNISTTLCEPCADLD
jgi:hypothetical protein